MIKSSVNEFRPVGFNATRGFLSFCAEEKFWCGSPWSSQLLRPFCSHSPQTIDLLRPRLVPLPGARGRFVRFSTDKSGRLPKCHFWEPGPSLLGRTPINSRVITLQHVRHQTEPRPVWSWPFAGSSFNTGSIIWERSMVSIASQIAP